MRKVLALALVGCLGWTSDASAQIFPRANRNAVPYGISDNGIPVIVESGSEPTSVIVENPSAAQGPVLLESGPHCAPPCAPHIWGSAEHLFWWVRGNPIPPLATSGGDGIIGDPGTQILFQDTLSYGPLNGGRVTLGGWFGTCQKWGWEGSGFLFENQHQKVSWLSPVGNLFVPGLDGGVEDSTIPLFAFVATTQLQMWSTEANLLYNYKRSPNFTVDFLAGFRYFDLDESLNIGIAGINDEGLASGFDIFRARNSFYGSQIGAKVGYRCNKLSVDFVCKVALGVNQRALNNSGTFFLNGVPVSNQGNLFVQPSNAGRFSDSHFAVLPETQIKLGYDVTPHIRLTGGYNFLLLSNVSRAGGSIDREILGDDPGRPRVQFGNSAFWAHGVTGGVEFRW